MAIETAELSLTLARWFCGAVFVYFLLGFGFAIPFLWRGGADALDPVVREASRSFRWWILPGVVAFWPLLLGKLRAKTSGEKP